MNALSSRLAIGLVLALAACGSDGGTSPDAAAPDAPDAAPGTPDGSSPPAADADLPAPDDTWTEHWFEHEQTLRLVDYNDEVAVYFDDDVTRAGTEWILPFMTDLWVYSEATYGDMGPDRLYLVFHEGRYSGGHPSYYFDESHDFRNVSDCGPGPWTSPSYDLPSHEVGHIVESTLHGKRGSPAFGIWGDSKWIEFYQYDAYVALGMTAEAERLFAKFTATVDDFPRAGTRWFRDWYHPLWRDHGKAQVMVRWFALVAEHFPKRSNGLDYARDMNFGEYVHFMSGAAETDLKALATAAFGWPAEREAEWVAARAEFPAITY